MLIAARWPEALPSLNELGKALTDPKLKGASILIAGHTDAKGSADYNLALSQRRAASVADFLIKTYHVDKGRLSVIGFGEEQLKNKEDPLADENRRVQIVNAGHANVAEGAHDAAPHNLGGREAADVLAGELHAAAVRAHRAGDQIEECGLAGAVRPDDRRQRARREVERDILHRGDAAEGFREVFDLQHGRHF